MENAVATISARDCARRVLAVCLAALPHADRRDAEITEGVREIGVLWARSGGSVDDLLAELNSMAGEFDDDGAPRYDACGRLAVELVRGFRQDEPEDTPAEPAVVVAFQAGEGSTEAVAAAFRRVWPDCEYEQGRVLLLSRSEEEAVRECRAVVARLAGQRVWMAVVDGAEPDGLACATRLLGIVRALDLPPGAYRRADVLVEHAAARSPVSSRVLRRLIAPVLESDSLRTTLAAFIAEGGNRTGAAERLIIHRSTIDYRLARIEQLTGHSPLTVRGLRVLTAAYALSTLSA